jgi:F0F1-type ATP synthase assembly protein I
MAQSDSQRRSILKTLLIVLVGQVGCLTLLVVSMSLLLGLWLDSTLHTRPVLTLVFLLAGVPLSVILMLLVARRTLASLVNEKKSAETRES